MKIHQSSFQDCNTLLSVLCEGNKLGTLVQPDFHSTGSPSVTTTASAISPTIYAALQMRKRLKPMGELALIEQIRRDFSSRQQSDSPLASAMTAPFCAPLPGAEILVTTDFTLEGRHFRRDLHPPGIGRPPLPGSRAQRSRGDGSDTAGGLPLACAAGSDARESQDATGLRASSPACARWARCTASRSRGATPRSLPAAEVADPG